MLIPGVDLCMQYGKSEIENEMTNFIMECYYCEKTLFLVTCLNCHQNAKKNEKFSTAACMNRQGAAICNYSL